MDELIVEIVKVFYYKKSNHDIKYSAITFLQIRRN